MAQRTRKLMTILKVLHPRDDINGQCIKKVRNRIHQHYGLRKYIKNRLIGLVGRVFNNGQRDLGSILIHVIPKTLKMVFNISLLSTQQYKVCIKDKARQSRERSSALPNISM